MRWQHADSLLRQRVEGCVDGDSDSATILADSARRQLILVQSLRNATVDGSLLIKRYRVAPQRRVTARLKQWLGQSAADREWRALRALAAHGLPVPEPLGLASLAGGERLLVLAYVEGRTLADELADDSRDSGALLESTGALIARLHAAGTTHRDLHVGNLLVTPKGPMLLDFQAARRPASKRDRVRDVASFDFSLAHHGVSAGQRDRFRRAALGLLAGASGAEPSPSALLEIERAATKYGQAYYRGRTRRCLRPGRRFRRVRLDSYVGMRLADFPEESLRTALHEHRRAVSRGGPAVLKCDHRGRVSGVETGRQRVVVKEVTKGGPAKRFADRFRGSPAQRAWLGGYGLRVRGIGAAEPLAYIEKRGLLGPRESLVVLEDLRPARPAAAYLHSDGDGDRRAAVTALRELVVLLHDRQVVHGDLQVHHVYLRRTDGRLHAALLDLEGVRFPRRLSDPKRVQALAELNASLHDELLGPRERLREFRHYAAALPFREGTANALERVIAQSRKRGHLWTGEGCDDQNAQTRIRRVSP